MILKLHVEDLDELLLDFIHRFVPEMDEYDAQEAVESFMEEYLDRLETHRDSVDDD